MMNQQDLREWERRCIQEEQPWCQSYCPLHVDARGFMERMKAGDFSAARKILEKTMPLPGVLGSICDHPCEGFCKRREAGEPIAIGALERAAIRLGRPGPKPLVLPAKGRKAAVLGAGLAALSCAWDLARKGYGVTIFCPGDRLGGRLLALPEDLLPPQELARELDRLAGMGVEARTGQAFSPELLEEVRAGFDAVFAEWGTPPCPASRGQADPKTLMPVAAGSVAGTGAAPVTAATAAGTVPQDHPDAWTTLFCGGWPQGDGKFSAISEAADGRRAAASMDRLLSGASLTAAREKEGPCETRLFTSLAGVTALPRVNPTGPDGVLDAGEAAREAARCLNCQCLECVKVCAYLDHYKGYPRKYARQIYNNAAIVQGVHQANKLVNTCMLCGLCTEVCPERFSMADLCMTARRDLVERSKMPPSAHGFALEDLAFNNGPGFALARPDPETGTCGHLFFPGCQLSASHPHHVESAYAFLREKLGAVGLMLRCCAVPALWAAREDLFQEAREELLTLWSGLGSPKVVVACSSCLAVFTERLPELGAESLWETFARFGLPEATGARPAGPVALHDPCTTRHEPAVQAGVRRALKALGVPYEELALGGAYTECCGYGGLMGNANPDVARKVASGRAARSGLDFAASCSMCRDRLAAEGKRAWHALDFVFPGPQVDPSAKGPGMSDRHERRARLKAGLLRRFWGEEAEAGGEAGSRLLYAPGVAEAMEERRILREDVEAVVAQAERTGRRLVDRQSGRSLASLRPRRVTYWVEYQREHGALVVTRAWSHRMDVPGAAGEAAS